MKNRYMKRKIVKHLQDDIEEYKEGIREDKKLLRKLKGRKYKRKSCPRKAKMPNPVDVIDRL